MDLDDELRRLLGDADERLDVPVRPDATEVITAGARRVRRRRIAAATATGALTAVALVAGAVILVGGEPDAMPPALRYTNDPPAAVSTTTTTTTTTSRTSTSRTTQGSATGTREEPPPVVESRTQASEPPRPQLGLPVVGPTGFQRLSLGQTLEEAQATGMLGDPSYEAEGGCPWYALLVDGEPVGSVYAGTHVDGITVYSSRTPEGAGPGWTAQQVKTVYPDLGLPLADDDGSALVSVPGNQGARYRLSFEQGAVTGFQLQDPAGACFA